MSQLSVKKELSARKTAFLQVETFMKIKRVPSDQMIIFWKNLFSISFCSFSPVHTGINCHLLLNNQSEFRGQAFYSHSSFISGKYHDRDFSSPITCHEICNLTNCVNARVNRLEFHMKQIIFLQTRLYRIFS